MPLTLAQRTAIHTRQQAALRDLTVRDVARLAYLLRFEALDESFPLFSKAVAVLVANNRRISTGVAAAYLRAARLLAGIHGEASIVRPPLALEEVMAALHVTTVAMAKKATARGVDLDVGKANAVSLAGGAMARLVLAGGRSTIGASVDADPFATGWRRVASGANSCEFCRSLNGEIYPSGVTDFECHDRCGCHMEPIFEGGA